MERYWLVQCLGRGESPTRCPGKAVNERATGVRNDVICYRDGYDNDKIVFCLEPIANEV